LEEDLTNAEHHLLVESVERRQPSQAGSFEILARNDRLHTRDLLHRVGDVDLLDLGVRIRTAYKRQVQHAGDRQVVNVVALALNEARILLALHGNADGVSSFGAHLSPS